MNDLLIISCFALTIRLINNTRLTSDHGSTALDSTGKELINLPRFWNGKEFGSIKAQLTYDIFIHLPCRNILLKGYQFRCDDQAIQHTE
jgi:hypothetical protein